MAFSWQWRFSPWCDLLFRGEEEDAVGQIAGPEAVIEGGRGGVVALHVIPTASWRARDRVVGSDGLAGRDCPLSF